MTEPLAARVEAFNEPEWSSDVHDAEPWLWRYADTAKVLACRDLPAQAMFLEEFARATFERLQRDPPAPTPRRG
jgi:hypothetical protein